MYNLEGLWPIYIAHAVCLVCTNSGMQQVQIALNCFSSNKVTEAAQESLAQCLAENVV